jgi:hypothetical protein
MLQDIRQRRSIHVSLQRTMQPTRTMDVAGTQLEYDLALGGRDGHPHCDQSFQPETKGTTLGNTAGVDCDDVRKFDARRNPRLGTHVGAEATASGKRAVTTGSTGTAIKQQATPSTLSSVSEVETYALPNAYKNESSGWGVSFEIWIPPNFRASCSKLC